MLPCTKSYCSTFKNSTSVTVTVKVTWDCSFLASVKIHEGYAKVAVKVRVSCVAFEDRY